jgi:glycosyltransferase involved in cell wall biosynthesis
MPYSVSIIINNYNYARFLPRAIESALTQTHRHVEVIVVDDGSTDGSRDIIRQYGKRICCVVKENGGQASAFNTGFAASTGTIILFLDADDILEPHAAAALAAAWRPNVGKVQFPLTAVDADERPLGYLLPRDRMCPGKEIELLKSYGYYPSPPSTGNAYARSTVEQLLPMPEEKWRLNADTYLIALAPFLGAVICLSEPLARYRIHGANGYVHRLDLPTLRRALVGEVERDHYVRQWAARVGSPIDRILCQRIPGHCKARLISLRLDRRTHPFVEDRIFSIVRAGLIAAWTFPHLTRTKRVLSLLAFPFIAVTPVFLLQIGMAPLFVPAARRIAMRSFGRWIRRVSPVSTGPC